MRSAIVLFSDRFASVADRFRWLPPLVARVSVGFVFLHAGWAKVNNLDRVISMFTQLEIPAPTVLVPLVAGLELGCGALVVLGLMARLASLPLIGIMAIATITAKSAAIHGLRDFLSLSEYLIAVVLLWLAIAGPGKVSLDSAVLNRGTAVST